MKASTLQRISAFFIDAIIVSIILALLTFWIPTSKKYDDTIKERNELIDKYLNEEIDMDELYNEFIKENYIIDKETNLISLIEVILTLGYFGTFAFYYNGQTLGKKMMNIKVVSDDEKDLSHLRFIGRTLIINNVLVSSITVLLLFFIKQNQYASVIGVLGVFQWFITIITLLFVLIRKDKRGLHDLIFKTKVVRV